MNPLMLMKMMHDGRSLGRPLTSMLRMEKEQEAVSDDEDIKVEEEGKVFGEDTSVIHVEAETLFVLVGEDSRRRAKVKVEKVKAKENGKETILGSKVQTCPL